MIALLSTKKWGGIMNGWTTDHNATVASGRASTIARGGKRGLRTVSCAIAALVATAAVHAQVKIGDNPVTINPGSALEVESTNRGVLIPRIPLTDRNTWGLNGNSPVEGMMIYNSVATTGVNGLQEGLSVWKNGQWISVDETPYLHVNSTAVGNSTLSNSGATGANAIAIGPNATASGAGSLAVGSGATASTTNAVALGTGASVIQAGGVALGSGSVASTAAGVAGYVPPTATAAQAVAIGATTSTLAAVSVGDAANGQFRQITGVAAGTADSDAVNVSQLKGVQITVSNIDQTAVKYDANPDGSPNYNSVTLGGSGAAGPVAVHNVAPGVAGTDAVNVNQLNSGIAGANAYTDARTNQLNSRIDDVARNAYAGVASAMAIQMPASYVPGKTVMRVGAGVFKGESAVGVSFRRTADNNAWSLTGGVGVSRAGAAATVGVEWVFN
jgi:autotransporter adhesin